MSSVPGPLLVSVAGVELTGDDRRLLAEPAVGGVILFTPNYRDCEQLANLTSAIRNMDERLLIVADTEGGRVQRFRDGFTRLPAMRRLGELFERNADSALETARDVGWLMASELVSVGIDLPLAPVVDVDAADSTVIGDRALSADTGAVSRLASALRQGLVEAGSAATVKHFPGHGAVAADSHHELPVDERPWPTLARDMAPYETLIADGLESVMPAHVRYPAVDDAPASLSRIWLNDILRSRLGFAGAVFSDDLSMAGAASVGDPPARARAALAAGCDFLPLCHDRASAEQAAATIGAIDTASSRERRRVFLDTLRARQTTRVTLDTSGNVERAQRVRAVIASLHPNAS